MTRIYSASLRHRIEALVERAIGSHGTLVFYAGEPPPTADDEPTGEKLGTRPLAEGDLLPRDGQAIDMPTGAGYWRLLDNGGLVVMQGGGDE